jgi:DeoR/GlpR family transcriptional regulator of sugar metabolism
MTTNKHSLGLGQTPRHSQILEVVHREGGCSVEDLALTLGVSTMTIRRDLQELSDAGQVLRTHGGAVPAARVSFEFRFLKDAQHNAQAKDQIAQRAAELVADGDSVMLDSSTTTLAIARRLRGMSLTVITTSLPIASELYGCEGIELILLGGSLRSDSPDLAGPITEANLESLHAKIAFIGADGIDKEGRIYNDSPVLGRMLNKMAASADRIYAVADHSKIGKSALMRFGDIKKWDGLITDTGLDPTWKRHFTKAGVKLIQPQDTRKAQKTTA